MVECCYVNVETPEGELMVYIRAQEDDGGMLLC